MKFLLNGDRLPYTMFMCIFDPLLMIFIFIIIVIITMEFLTRANLSETPLSRFFHKHTYALGLEQVSEWVVCLVHYIISHSVVIIFTMCLGFSDVECKGNSIQALFSLVFHYGIFVCRFAFVACHSKHWKICCLF